MTKKACQEAESLYEFYEESFEKMAKKNEKNIPSDYHRLYGNISMMYANVCLSGFGQVRKLISSTKQFDKALEKDKNNFEAHIASGVWRYYAPKIGEEAQKKPSIIFKLQPKMRARSIDTWHMDGCLRLSLKIAKKRGWQMPKQK